MAQKQDPDYAARLAEAREQAGEDNFSIVAKPVETREAGEDGFLLEARERALMASEWWETNFAAAEVSVNMSAGLDHWEAYALAERQGRPCLTFNTLPQYLDQLNGQMRQSRPAIKVSAGDDYSDAIEFIEDKTKRKIKGAEVFGGIIRAIEQQSSAEAHYDTAGEHARDGGFGWLRVVPQYASGKSFDQVLRIRHVRNRWAVLLDPDFEEPDGSDARFGFIFGQMNRREWDKRYPDKARADLAGLTEKDRTVWLHGDKVGYAEYMWREAVEEEIGLLSNGQIGNLKELLTLLPSLPPMQDGSQIAVVRSRRVLNWRVYWQKISAAATLEKKITMPFTTIPIVPVFGKEKHLRTGVTLYRSAIADALDPKRAENYWLSAATERIALAPSAPWVGSAEAVEGYESEWEDANNPRRAFLPYNGEAERPERVPVPQMPAAEVQMAAIMVDHVKASVGIYDASLGAQSNETSGRALLARQNQSNNSSFAFTDNQMRAVRRVGLLLLEAIPKIYDAERVMQLRGEDGTDTWLKVNTTMPGPDGKPVVINSLGDGEFDLVVKAGPSYSTQRQETAEAMTEMVRIAPDLLPVVGDVLVESMDWPGAARIAKRMKKTMDPKLLTQGEVEEMQEEQGQPVEAPPSPEEEAQAAVMEIEAKKAEAAKIEADAALIAAQAKLAAAQNDAALAQDGGALAGMVRQEVATALAEFIQQAKPQPGASA